MTEFLRIELSDIDIEERFRQDYGDIESLAESILDKGMLQPVVVTPTEDGKYLLCAGGRRMQAFEEARKQWIDTGASDSATDWPYNISQVPVHVIETTEELDLREIELVENVLRKDMSWSETVLLQKKIHELMEEKHPKDWTMRQTAKLLMKSPGAITDNLALANVLENFPMLASEPTADSARKKFKRVLEQTEVRQELSKAEQQKALHEALPEGSSPVESLSNTDYWLPVISDAYRIGDAIAGMLASRPGSAHFAEVDPPYGVDLIKEKSDGAAGIKSYNEVAADQYEDFLKRTCEALYQLMAEDSFVVWWHAPTWNRETLDALRNAGFKVDDIPAIWNKVNAGAAANNPDVYLGRSYEPFYIARKGQPVLRKRGKRNVFDFKPIPAPQKFHPTERPIALIRDILSTFLYPGARVVVPFLGSGNSLIAAYQEGAKLCWGWELSESYRNGFLVKAKAELMGKSQREYELEAIESIGEAT